MWRYSRSRFARARHVADPWRRPTLDPANAGASYINENFISDENEDRDFISAALGDFRYLGTVGYEF